MPDLKPPNFDKLKKKIEQKTQLLQTLKKKKECEKKALDIVIELIDGGLEEHTLLNKLCSINACHYEDVIEERFILKLCGYVMCNQQLTSILSQQYKIVQNQVFDITERKKFCSNTCYKSSKYLHSQLLTSPLWLRDTEVIPKFKLFKTSIPSDKEINADVSRSFTFQTNDKNEKLHEKLSEIQLF